LKKTSKWIDIAVTAAAVGAIVIAIAALWTVLTTEKGDAPQLWGISLLRVVSGSMEPNIPEGAVVFVKETDPKDLEEGDVISFYSRDPAIMGEINTHRIAEVGTDEKGRLCFITKGDANAIKDPYVVYGENLLGKVVFSSALFGSFVSVAASKYGYIFLVLAPLLLIVIFNIGDIVNIIRSEAEAELDRESEHEEDK